ncbi:QRIC2 protein, partial [Galbula dea]|nr:QRIC2 protein [Galbula dea]
DEKQLKHIEATVMQLSGNYEKLSSVTGNLLDEHHEKQKAIEVGCFLCWKVLSQSLENLKKEKADKKDLLQGIDEKADKSALAGKVSHSQFDANMERLKEMIQEIQSQVSIQEQGWQQLKEEMASKVDNVELGPFRRQLLEQWKSILKKKLKEKEPVTTADNAAGIKKQLLPDYHCLSCDQPIEVKVPG